MSSVPEPGPWQLRHLIEEAETACTIQAGRRERLSRWPSAALEDLATGWAGAHDDVVRIAWDILRERGDA